MAIRNFSYGAWAPTEGLEQVEQQMRLAHRYRNRLCELELARRASVDAALRELSPNLADTEARLARADEALEQAVAAQRSRNQAAGTRKVTKDDREAIKALRARRREAAQARKDLRKELFASTTWQERKTAIAEEHKAATKAARANCGLYWGTYLQVEESTASFAQGAPPRFRVWAEARRNGMKLAVQLQHGISVNNLTSCEDTRLRLSIPDGWRRRGRAADCDLWFRVGSTGRAPVWARVRVRLHRPLPPDARIKWCYLIRSQVGLHPRWRVVFVLEGDFDRPARGSGRVALDIGWRALPNGGLRVATWSGEDGREGELVLGPRWVSQYHRVEAIRSVRDQNLDNIREWLRAEARAGHELPEALAEALPHIHTWKSPARFAALALKMRAALPEWLAPLEAWRGRDAHLLAFEAHLRDQLQAGRCNAYRTWAARLSERYGKCVLEDMDLREFHKLPDVEDGGGDDDKGARVRRNPRLACLSSLRDALGARFEIEWVPAPGTTIKCHACGRDSGIPAGEAGRLPLVHQCVACKAEWDQDGNAGRNLLAASGADVHWRRPPLDGCSTWTYNATGPRAVARRRVRRGAIA